MKRVAFALLLGSLGCGGATPDGGDARVCALGDGSFALIGIDVCDGVDNDCNGVVDDGPNVGILQVYRDVDGDGFGDDAVTQARGCVFGDWVARGGDCAPNDPAIHPEQLDECATQTDANCDGVYRPVFVSPNAGPVGRTPAAVEEAFVQAGPSDAPVKIGLGGVTGAPTTIDLCPGTYRVSLELGLWGDGTNLGTFIVRGHGATPADVVLDAGDSTVNVATWPIAFGEFLGSTSATFQNLTLAHGADALGEAGCVTQAGDLENAADLTLEHVIVRDCAAPRGAAIRVPAGRAALTLVDTTFLRTTSSVAGGAIDFAGTTLSMTGGGFSSVSAPAGTGSAIAATLNNASTLDLAGVDLGAVTDDLAVTTTGAPILRDLGASATLHCDAATGCTP